MIYTLMSPNHCECEGSHFIDVYKGPDTFNLRQADYIQSHAQLVFETWHIERDNIGLNPAAKTVEEQYYPDYRERMKVFMQANPEPMSGTEALVNHLYVSGFRKMVYTSIYTGAPADSRLLPPRIEQPGLEKTAPF